MPVNGGRYLARHSSDRDVPTSETHAQLGRVRSLRNRFGMLALISVALGGPSGIALASVEQGLRVHLATRLPLNARPASTVRVEWRLVGDSNRVVRLPTGTHMFVRLLSRTGESSTTGGAQLVRQNGESFEANVRAPAGGIGGIRIGLRGSSKMLLLIQNDPFTTPQGIQCDVATLGTTLRAFVRAYNRGNVRDLDRLFSRERFRWYATSGPGRRQPPESRDRDTLASYLRQRHRLGDRLELRAYRFNGYERARNLGHFEFEGNRSADDFRDGHSFRMVGKGALDCSRKPITFGVMFIGGDGR